MITYLLHCNYLFLKYKFHSIYNNLVTISWIYIVDNTKLFFLVDSKETSYSQKLIKKNPFNLIEAKEKKINFFRLIKNSKTLVNKKIKK